MYVGIYLLISGNFVNKAVNNQSWLASHSDELTWVQLSSAQFFYEPSTGSALLINTQTCKCVILICCNGCPP